MRSSPTERLNRYDVVVVGGGPAGLTSALILGRCRRRVLVFDTGNQRNKASGAIHGFPTRDGERPQVFLATLRSELSAYGVRIIKKRIASVHKTGDGFLVNSSDGGEYRSAMVLLATGLSDELPPIPGIQKYYGKGVFHCPYCDGYEYSDKPWVVCAFSGKAAVEVCLRVKTWTSDIVLLASYARVLTQREESLLKRNGIKISWQKVRSVAGRNGHIRGLVMADGRQMACDAFMFSSPSLQQSGIALELGCTFNRQGQVRTNRLQQTCVPGLYAAGDMARDMELMVIAASEGAKAAVAMNATLNRMIRKA